MFFFFADAVEGSEILQTLGPGVFPQPVGAGHGVNYLPGSSFRGAEWMIRGAEKHHPLGFKQHPISRISSINRTSTDGS